MKKIIISLFTLALYSCEYKGKKYLENNEVPYGLSVQIIDSCEYIIIVGSNKASIIHKQNCKNHK